MRKHEKSKKREKRRNLVQVGEVESIYTGPTSRQEKNRKKKIVPVWVPGRQGRRRRKLQAINFVFSFFFSGTVAWVLPI
uniref:Uncharacterized protein n=1 Tax=Candidozyma auris TaxID=498019 RepID=A0A0L0P2Y9_CANAR